MKKIFVVHGDPDQSLKLQSGLEETGFADIVVPDVRELKALRRLSVRCGEDVEVAFELDADLFAFVGRDLRWIVEPGTFEIHVGASPTAIRLTTELALTGAPRVIPKRRRHLAREVT